MAKSNPKKYAKALFEVYDVELLEEKSLVLSELSSLWSQDQELKSFFSNPAVKYSDKESILTEICTICVKDDNYFLNFLRLLLENKKISLLPEISKEFTSLYQEFKKAMSLDITTAKTVEDEEKQDILNFLRRDVNSLVSVGWKVNDELIGGFTVKSKDQLLDSSVKGSLEKIKKSLVA